MKPFSGAVMISAVALLLCSFAFKGKDSTSLEGKLYKVTTTEVKKGKSGKPDQDEISFKGGKFKSKTAKVEMGADAIPIELNVDSVYVQEGSDDNEDIDMIYVEFEGEFTNKMEETVKVVGTVDGYGIEGSIELSKKGKLKRHFDFVGSQKDGKKKK
jgi:hypothetical protein